MKLGPSKLEKSGQGSHYVFSDEPGGRDPWPVGSIYMSNLATNPAATIGYGTWTAYGTGRVIVGYDSGDGDFDAAGDTGGAKTVTLDTTMIPAHTHTQDAHNHTQDAHNHTQDSHTHGFTNLRGLATGAATTNMAVTEVADVSSTPTTLLTAATTATNQATTATNQAATATNQNTGGGLAHNNMPPFIVAYFWLRTA